MKRLFVQVRTKEGLYGGVKSAKKYVFAMLKSAQGESEHDGCDENVIDDYNI